MNHTAFPGGPVARTALSLFRVWVQSLVRELRSYKPHSMAKKLNLKMNQTSDTKTLF